MKYFEIDEYERQSPDYCFIDMAPEEIYLLSGTIMKGGIAQPDYPPDDVIAVMSDEGGRVCTDFIANEELSLMVSERIKNIISATCDTQIEYLPFKIKNHKGRIEEGTYYYINPIGTVDVVNVGASDISVDDKGNILDADDLVFDQSKLKDLPNHIFRVKEWPKKYFMSEYLVNKINHEVSDVKNFNTIPVDIT